jgi:hypothetical protein
MFPCLRVHSRSYKSLGHEIGVYFKQRIQTYASTSQEVAAALIYISTPHGLEHFQELVEFNSKVFPEFVPQLIGLSEGCGMTLRMIWVLNLVDELNRLYEKKQAEEEDEDEDSDEDDGSSADLSLDESAGEMEIDVLPAARGARLPHGHCTSIHLHRSAVGSDPGVHLLAHNEDADPSVASTGYIIDSRPVASVSPLSIWQPHATEESSKADTYADTTPPQLIAFCYPGTLPGVVY